jgi:hypothetical protein
MLSKYTEITNEQIRSSSAYHEAGHAVIATTCGWSVNHEGVEIDDRAYTGLELSVWDNNTWRQIHVNLAGWLSEHKFHGLGGLREEADLEYLIQLSKAPETADDMDIVSDDFCTFEALLEDYPDATDKELISKYREYQREVTEELNEPHIWNAVETLATELIKKGKVEGDDANELIHACLDYSA